MGCACLGLACARLAHTNVWTFAASVIGGLRAARSATSRSPTLVKRRFPERIASDATAAFTTALALGATAASPGSPCRSARSATPPDATALRAGFMGCSPPWPYRSRLAAAGQSAPSGITRRAGLSGWALRAGVRRRGRERSSSPAESFRLRCTFGWIRAVLSRSWHRQRRPACWWRPPRMSIRCRGHRPWLAARAGTPGPSSHFCTALIWRATWGWPPGGRGRLALDVADRHRQRGCSRWP